MEVAAFVAGVWVGSFATLFLLILFSINSDEE